MLLAAVACGQAATGTISGVVLDPQHKAVPNATVTVVGNDIGGARLLHTQADGTFAAAQLVADGYAVQASAPGLKMARPQRVTVGVGSSVSVTLVLQVVQAGQEVTVTGRAALVEGQTAAPGVDKRSPQVTNAVAGLKVTYMPNRSREFGEFGMLSADSADTDQGLSVSGQRPAATKVEVDGFNFDDPLEGGVRGAKDGGPFFPQTAVQEMSLVHAGAAADVGGTNGGFLNVATKPGRTRLQGEEFAVLRPREWSGNDAFGHSLNNTVMDFGLGIGYHLIPKKLYYYFGVEHDEADVPYYTEFQPQAPATAIPANLVAQQVETVGHNTPTAASLRVDFDLNAHTVLTLQENFNYVRFSNYDPGSTQVWTAASAGMSLAGQSDWTRMNLTSTLGGVVNQVMAQWAGDRRDFMPTSSAPEVSINGFGVLGGGALAENRYVSGQRGASDEATLSWHAHLINFGGGWSEDPGSAFEQANLNGLYAYNSLSDYLAGNPYRFQQTFAASPGALLYQGTERRGDFFINDRYPLTEALALTAGLRWDGQWNPQPASPNAAIPGTSVVPDDLRQWQPRLGLAWNPEPSTVVRVSAGLYDAPTPASYFNRLFTDNGINAVVADSVFDPALLTLAAGGNGLPAPPPSLTPPAALAVGIASGFRNPRSFQTAASLQQQLGKRINITTGYTHNSTWNLERTVEANLNPPSLDANGMPIFPAARPLPGVGQLLRFDSGAHSRYDGWATTASFAGPYSLGLTANYTWARTLDDASQQGPFGMVTALDPLDLRLEAGYANQDVRNSFNISGTDRLPLGFKINPVFMARSGLPYTPIIGFDTQNDGNDFNDRAILNGQVAGRNSLRQPPMVDLDIRFVKDFTLKRNPGRHLDLFLDVFNITNHGNREFGPEAVGYYGNAANPVFAAGLPLFAPSTSAFGGSRTIQFTARMVEF